MSVQEETYRSLAKGFENALMEEHKQCIWEKEENERLRKNNLNLAEQLEKERERSKRLAEVLKYLIEGLPAYKEHGPEWDRAKEALREYGGQP